VTISAILLIVPRADDILLFLRHNTHDMLILSTHAVLKTLAGIICNCKSVGDWMTSMKLKMYFIKAM